MGLGGAVDRLPNVGNSERSRPPCVTSSPNIPETEQQKFDINLKLKCFKLGIHLKIEQENKKENFKHISTIDVERITTENTFTGGRQIPTAAITISQHGGRRSRYKIIFTVYAIIKHPFMLLRVCIHRNSMYALIEHFHLHYIVATFAARRRGRKQRADGNLHFSTRQIWGIQ